MENPRAIGYRILFDSTKPIFTAYSISWITFLLNFSNKISKFSMWAQHFENNTFAFVSILSYIPEIEINTTEVESQMEKS